MTDTLSAICAKKREHLQARKAAMPEPRLLQKIRLLPPPRGFRRALENTIRQGRFGLIGEIKKASPSGGLIRPDFDPTMLAKAYEAGGAACLSVLTDEPYFQGKDEYLGLARDAVALPVLRKDFILEPYQIVESRALGADCVLIILAAIDDRQAMEMQKVARSFGMDVLVEVHNQEEMERALVLQPNLIGINNRDLKTLKIDLAISESLAKHLPPNILGVSESGIKSPADLKRMKNAGISCFLVGESLMRQTDVARATRALLG